MHGPEARHATGPLILDLDRQVRAAHEALAQEVEAVADVDGG